MIWGPEDIMYMSVLQNERLCSNMSSRSLMVKTDN